MNLRNLFWFFLLLLLGACQTPPRATESIEFTFLQMNDVYEITPLEGGKAGGLARVATIKKELSEENPNTLAVLAGDFLSPSFAASLSLPNGQPVAGLQMVETLNALGLDYVTFGNHEFDLEDAALLQQRMDQSNFLYVCSNVRQRQGDQLVPFQQKVGGVRRPVPPYIIHEFEGANGEDVKVAILGVVLPFNQSDYVAYTPVVESFREAYRAARAEADVVVALTHLDEEQDMELAEAVPGIPLFMGGHDHHHMSHYVENTVIAKADANAKTVYIHRLTYYPASGAVTVRSTLRQVDEQIPDDPETQAVVKKWKERVLEVIEAMNYDATRQLSVLDEPLLCTEKAIRSTQTNYGRLAAKAFEKAWPGADVYLINSGAMRLDDDISGVITVYDVLRTFPFGGEIVRMALPGNVLQDVIRNGLIENQGQGGYLQLWRATLENDRCLINGAPLVAGQVYSVVLPKFLADGLESNLEMLGDYEYEMPDSFNIGGQTLRNDVRDIVIRFLADQP